MIAKYPGKLMIHQFSQVLSFFQVTWFYQSEPAANLEEILQIKMKVGMRWSPFKYFELALLDFFIELNQDITYFSGELLDVRSPFGYNLIAIYFEDTMESFS